MSKNLQLQVVLNAIDKATAPIKGIMKSTDGLGKQLKETRDRLRAFQSQQGDVESFKKLRAASELSSKAMAEQQQKVRDLALRMRETDAPTKAMTKEFKAATREAHRLKEGHIASSEKMQVLRTRLNEAGISTGKAKNGTEKFGIAERNLRNRIDETNKSLADQKNRLQAVTDHQKRLASAKRQYERTTRMASSMTTAGAGGIAAGGGVLYGLGRFMQTGIEFDKAMSNVRSLVQLDNDSPEMKRLREQSKQLGAETSFTANQAAEGQGFLAVAGFSPESILQSMPAVMDLAKAGGIELSAAAEIASGTLLAMGLNASDMGRVGDVLTSTFTNTKTSIESISETMKMAAPILSSLGVDIETVAAMTGVLGDNMILGSAAGTGMSTIFTRLADPVKATAAALDKIGVSAVDAAGKFRHPEELLGDIYEKTKKLSETERLGVFAAISGQNALKSMIPLVNAAGNGALNDAIKARREAAGISAATAKIASDNLSGDLEGLSSAFDGIKLTVFEDQNSAMRELIATFTELLRSVNTWAKDNPELVATLVKGTAVIAAMVAAGGALTLTIGSILGPLAMLKYGLTLVGIAGGTALAPVVLVVAALALAAFLLYKNWDTIKAFFIGLWAEVKEAFSGGIGGISALIVNWTPLGLFYKAFAGVMSYFGVELPDKFTDFGGMIMQGLVNGIKNMGGAVKGAVVGMGDSVTGWFKDKLGIRSPSRVFMQFGSDTAEGLAAGIAANKDSPLKQVASMSRQLAAAGALSMAAGMSFASDIQFDSRPPIASPSAAQGSGVTNNTNYYTINVSGGGDHKALANEVLRQIEAYDRQKQVQKRSRFGDLD